MSEWKLVRINEQNAQALAKKKWPAEELAEFSNALKARITANLWPCANVQMEFRGFEGYDAVVIFEPLPCYSSQENTVYFRRPVKGNSLAQLRNIFDQTNENKKDIRLLLQTANGGILNLTNYVEGTSLRTIWEPTWLWKTTLDSLCVANKNINVILHNLMQKLPNANQDTFDILRRAVFANQWELKDKITVRSPQLTLESIVFSDLAQSVCECIDVDKFFD